MTDWPLCLAWGIAAAVVAHWQLAVVTTDGALTFRSADGRKTRIRCTVDSDGRWRAAVPVLDVCERCGLPFERERMSKVISKELRATLEADGQSVPPNTHCPRFLGDDERWDCDGKELPR